MNAPLEPAYLDPYQAECHFPDVSLALEEPDGLLAVGGNLSVETLFNAYRHGVFPWYNDGQPILWWSPNPRAVIFPERLRVSRSLKKRLRQQRFEITLDHAFDEVIQACANARRDGLGTWISAEMQHAYIEMHRLGHAHSVEAWRDGKLVGGLYGIAIGQVFFGESMFSRESDTSKVAFVHLVLQLKKWQFSLIDCQVGSNHMSSLGTEEIARPAFIDHIESGCNRRSLAPKQWKNPLLLPDSD